MVDNTDQLKYLLEGWQALALNLEEIDPKSGLERTIQEIERVCSAEFSGQVNHIPPKEQKQALKGKRVSLYDALNREGNSFFRVDQSHYVIPLAHQQGILALRNISEEFRALSPAQMNPIFQYLALKVGNLLVQKNEQESALEKSNIDSLTGLLNRGAFDEIYSQLLEIATAEEIPLSVIFGDLDHFGGLNDTYGHPHGDQALRAVGEMIGRSVRTSDYSVSAKGRGLRDTALTEFLEKRGGARYGGEEFIIPLLGVRKKDAIKVAERGRKNVASLNLGHVEAIPQNGVGERKEYHLPSNQIQMSIGVATFPEDAQDGPSLLKCVDQALYTAKSEGRNRVVAYSPL